MGDDFGIGFRSEFVSLVAEFLTKLLIVLNDAIVDHSHSVMAIELRMSVELSNAAMGCPASMPDGDVSRQACQAMLLNDFVDLAGVFLY